MAETEKKPKAEPKEKRSSVQFLTRKAYQYAKQAEQAAQREDGHMDEFLVKLRSILNMCLPGFEKQLRNSKALDEPGVRDFLLECKFRV